MFYMVFMRQFLSTKIKHPFLYKLYNFGIIRAHCLPLSVITYFHYFTDNFAFENNIEN